MSDRHPFRCPHCHEANWSVIFEAPAERPAAVFVVGAYLEAEFEGSAAAEPLYYHCERCHTSVWADGAPVVPLGMSKAEAAAYLAARLPEP